MVHDAIEAVGGHHYKGGWAVNDAELYRYHIFRIYDIFVPEEDYVRLDYVFSEMYADIAKERNGESFSLRRIYLRNRQTLNRRKLDSKSRIRGKRPNLPTSGA